MANWSRLYAIVLNMSFSNAIYDNIKKLFPDGTVETLVTRPDGAPPGTLGPAVRLIHIPTGSEIICRDFPTQIENYIAAAIRLRNVCDKPAA